MRIAEGLDCSSVTSANGEDEHGILAQSSYDLAGNTLMHADSDLSMSTQIPRVQSVPTIGTETDAELNLTIAFVSGAYE